MDELRLDGNSAAGLPQEVFPFEMTTTSSRCQGCGAIEPLGALLSHGGAGQGVRCPHCESVVLRIVHSDGRSWLDLRGAGYLELGHT
jgi:DNA-directed RNA polymerase subunit RPC12/RpoP